MKRALNNETPMVMGILNVTPDSFSDGGCYLDPVAAVNRGLEMAAEGADILDVGGESTRPGSRGVDEQEEKQRIVPVIEKLSELTDVLISVDTVKPGVARAAIAAGARMINDVSNLRDGVGLAEQAAEAGAYLVLMHSRGTPETMQRQTAYSDVVQETVEELVKSAQTAIGCGVPQEKIWLDPGIGFAKTAEQSTEILCRLEEITALDYPILVGPSRKSFIGKITGADIHNRLGGTAAAVTVAVMKGASAVRVHDVAMMRQASLIAREISRAGAVGQSKGEAANA